MSSQFSVRSPTWLTRTVAAILLCSVFVTCGFYHDTKVPLTAEDYGAEVADLPPPRQNSSRLLVGISAFNSSDHPARLVQLLVGLTEACENGLEVHVVIFTVTSWKHTPLDRRHQFHCNRLLRDIPIAVSRHKPDVKFLLSALHRQVFSDLLSRYDYFLYTEHDLAMKWHHLKYLTHWESRLKNTIFSPGLVRYEINRTRDELPKPLRPITDHFLAEPVFFPVQLATFEEETLAIPTNGYQAMWFLSQDRLAPFVRKPTWLADFFADYGRFAREYFAGGWYEWDGSLRKVVPLSQFNIALIHHTSNMYALQYTGGVERRNKGGTVSLEEAMILMERCTGKTGLTAQHLSIKDSSIVQTFRTGVFDTSPVTPCKACLSLQHYAWVSAKFSETYSTVIESEFKCIKDLQPSHFTHLFPNYQPAKS